MNDEKDGALRAQDTDKPSAETSPKRVDRRKFLGQVGMVAAVAKAIASPTGASAQPSSVQASGPDSSGCALPPGYPPVVNVPLGPSGRITEATIIRDDNAATDAGLGSAVNLSNGDSQMYTSKLGTFTKGLMHDQFGVVKPGSYQSLISALESGSFAAFENIIYGGSHFPPGQNHTLNGPQGALAYDLKGPNAVQYGQPQVPPAPGVASDQSGTEMVEMYWASLTRDVAFLDYGTGAGTDSKGYSSMAAAELTTMPCYTGPRTTGGQVTPGLLFRGSFPGESLGPYISQLALIPTALGSQPISQQQISYQAGLDYMTDFVSWLKVQNGWLPPNGNVQVGPYYLHDGRGLGALSKLDVLYNEYLIAAAVLAGIGAPLNPGNPYLNSKTENGFVTFGGPDIFSMVGAVASRSLVPTWYQKWYVHLRLRPEAAGGIVYLNKTGKPSDVTMSSVLLNSQALATSHSVNNSWLLSQAFPEGSPVHPAYPTGHGTVGGACLTILKFIFDGNYILPNPVQSSADGLSLIPYTGSDANQLSVNGELAKLGHNITFAHGIHPGIHWRSDSDTSLLIGEQIGIAFLQDLADTYNEPFSITITKFDGTPVTISNVGHP